MNILYEMFPECHLNDAKHHEGGPPKYNQLNVVS